MTPLGGNEISNLKICHSSQQQIGNKEKVVCIYVQYMGQESAVMMRGGNKRGPRERYIKLDISMFCARGRQCARAVLAKTPYILFCWRVRTTTAIYLPSNTCRVSQRYLKLGRRLKYSQVGIELDEWQLKNNIVVIVIVKRSHNYLTYSYFQKKNLTCSSDDS